MLLIDTEVLDVVPDGAECFWAEVGLGLCCSQKLHNVSAIGRSFC